MKTLKSKISLGVIFLFAVILLLSVLGIMFINHLAHKSKGTIVEVFDHFAKFRDDAQIKELIEIGPDFQFISTYGASKKSFEKVCVGSNYEIIEENLKKFVKFKKQMKKRLLAYSLRLVRYAKELPWQDQVLKVAQNQVIRSGTSMAANYFEATAGSSRKDFTNFNNHALKSANETVFWLLFLDDYLDDSSEVRGLLLQETQELANLFGSIVLSSKSQKDKKDFS